MRLSQVRVLADDVAASFRFYRAVLDAEPSFGDGSGAYVSWDTPGGTVAIVERETQGGVVGLRLPGDGAVVVLAVDDLDATDTRLRAAGIEPLGEIQARPDWGIRFLHLRDPDGTLVEVVQEIPLEES